MHSFALQIADDSSQLLRFGQTIESKARQHRGPRRAEERDRAAVHSGARPYPGVATYKNDAARHIETDHIASRTADGDYAFFHQQADFISGIAIDDDRSAAHPLCGAAVGRTDLMAGIALDADQPLAHFVANPIAGVALRMDFAAAELAAEVPTSRAMDVNLARPHLGADPVDAGEIAFEVKSFITGIANHFEHLGEGQFLVAVKNLEPLDLRGTDSWRLGAGAPLTSAPNSLTDDDYRVRRGSQRCT